MALAQQKAQLEAELMREAHQLKLAEFAMAQEVHRQKMEHAQQLHEHSLAQTQFGIAAGAQAHEQKMAQAKSRPPKVKA